MIGIVDRIFVVVFARYRRKMGDGAISIAWNKARSNLLGYLIFPIVALTSVLVLVLYYVNGLRLPLDKQDRLIAQIVVGVVVLGLNVFLKRRYRSYLAMPPSLSPREPPNDSRVLLLFRAGSVGFFLAICLLGFALYRVANT